MSAFDKDDHVAEHCGLFGADLTLFSDDAGGRTVAVPFVDVESRGLEPPTSLLSVVAVLEEAA